MDDPTATADDLPTYLSTDPPLKTFHEDNHLQSYPDEALLAAIVQSSDDAIISKSLDNVITSWNPAAERLFGYLASEVLGTPLLEMIPNEQNSLEEQMTGQIIKEERGATYETKRLTKDGKLLDVSLTSSPIRDKAGKLIGITKVVRDITTKKLEERISLEKEEKYRLALETARIGTWSFDPATAEIIVSPEVRRLYRFPTNLPLDLHTMEARMHPDDADLVRNARARAFDPASNGQYGVEHRIITYEGNEVKWIRVKGMAYFDAEGKPEKLFGTFLDVTDERMAKEELERRVAEKTLDLQKTNEQLLRSNEDLEQFAYVASHDLQEPLRKIHTFVDIIRLKNEKESLDSYLDKIIQSTRRMSTLIKDVLAYSRLGHTADLVKLVDLNSILSEVEADYDALIQSKNATIQRNDLPVVMGIPVQLRQVFANLISNSLKFSQRAPQINITGRLLPAEELGQFPDLDRKVEYVELLFADNGIGFDPQYAERMFMIFQRLHSQSKYEGTGVGLALVKKIVGNHRGLIKAESNPGKGAVFTILLPLA